MPSMPKIAMEEKKGFTIRINIAKLSGIINCSNIEAIFSFLAVNWINKKETKMAIADP